MVAVLLRLFVLGVAALQVEAMVNKHGALLKRDFTPQNPVLPKVPGASAPCAGLTTCAGGAWCCPADQFCYRSGCIPAGVTTCLQGYCQAEEGCCFTGCYPLNVGAQCCGGKGYWCPAEFQCIRYDVTEYKCCTDNTCDVYWDGTSTITVSVSTTTSTTTTMTTSVELTTTNSTTSTTKSKTTAPNTVSLSTPTAVTTSIKPLPTKCNPTGPQPSFFLQNAPNSYLTLAPAPGSNGKSSVVHFIDHNDFTLFTFNNACNLVDVDNSWIATLHDIPYEGGSVPVSFDSVASTSTNGYFKLVCDLQAGKQLACHLGTAKPGKWLACQTPSALQYLFSGTGVCTNVVTVAALLQAS